MNSVSILARDEFDHGTATPTPQLIEEVFVREGRLFEVHVAGRALRTTPEHPFYVRGAGWIPAGQLEPGDLLSTPGGEWLPVERVADTGQWHTVYNFRVSEYHTYFIAPGDLAFDVWVHNAYKVASGTRLPSSAYGEFLGDRGNSAFRLNSTTADFLGLAQGTTVNFKRGRVDFSPFSQGNFRVKGLNGFEKHDTPLIENHLAKRLGFLKADGTSNLAALRRHLSANNLTPHHAGGSAIQLIDFDLHYTIRHTGGAYDLRNGV